MAKFDIKEIVTAYITKLNPREDQKKLAEERAMVCNECTHPQLNDLGIRYCDLCGCIISAKIYSPKENPCPLAKWKCDIPYFTAKVNRHRLI